MKNRIILFALGVLIVGAVFVMTQYSEDKTVLKNIQAPEKTAPLPQNEDVLRLFFGLIDEGKVSEAVMMMSPATIGDESNKQAWGVMWNAFEEMKVVSVTPESDTLYRVVLDTKMKPGSESVMPIPYYGYGDGEFTRWVEIEEVEGVWKIKGVATGP